MIRSHLIAQVERPLPAREFDGDSRTSGLLRIDCLPAVALPADILSAWDRIRHENTAYRSPFFSHQFVQAVARLTPHVEVAVARQGGSIQAIFPFQRRRGSVARPVGAGINDAHGPLLPPAATVCSSQLLHACGIQRFPFHAAPDGIPQLAEFAAGTTPAFLADLTVDPRGYEHFLCQRNSTIRRQGQKTRRMARELGPLRFEFDCRDPRVLDQFLELKSQHYRRMHIFDIFRVEWIRRLLQELQTEETTATRGVLNVLYAGRTPVALHYGLIENDWMHYWFPTYDPRFGEYSPGTQLFLDIANRAQELGLVAIDMGYGEQAYKHKLTNVVTSMQYGMLDRNPWRRAWFHRQWSLRNQLRSLKAGIAIKPIVRRWLPEWGRSRFDA